MVHCFEVMAHDVTWRCLVFLKRQPMYLHNIARPSALKTFTLLLMWELKFNISWKVYMFAGFLFRRQEMRFTIYRTGVMLAGWGLTWDPSNKCLVPMLASGCSFTPNIFQTRSCNPSIHPSLDIYLFPYEWQEMWTFSISFSTCHCSANWNSELGLSVWNDHLHYFWIAFIMLFSGVLNFKWPWLLLETYRTWNRGHYWRRTRHCFIYEAHESF